MSLDVSGMSAHVEVFVDSPLGLVIRKEIDGRLTGPTKPCQRRK